MKAYRHLIQHAIDHGCKVNVLDEETGEWTTFETSGKAIDEVEAFDGGASFSITTPEGDEIGVRPAIGYGNRDEETVADFHCHPFIDAWFNDFCERYP